MLDLEVCLQRLDVTLGVFACIAHLGLGAAGAWGFPLASTVFLLDQRLSIYMGIQACYFSIFGIVSFLAELRQAKLQETVLKPLNFLHSHLGRGLFALYTGSSFLFLPWDRERPWVNSLVGGLEIAAGALLCAFAYFAPASGQSGSPKKSAGSAIMWGKSEAAASAEAVDGEEDTDSLPTTVVPMSPTSSGPIIVGNPFLQALSGMPRSPSPTSS